jgi:hypothetical protein
MLPFCAAFAHAYICPPPELYPSYATLQAPVKLRCLPAHTTPCSVQVDAMMTPPSSAAGARGGTLEKPWRAEVAELLLSVTMLEALLTAQQTAAAAILPCDLLLGDDSKKGAALQSM